MGLFAKKYKVDYCGQKMAYPNAKDEYIYVKWRKPNM